MDSDSTSASDSDSDQDDPGLFTADSEMILDFPQQVEVMSSNSDSSSDASTTSSDDSTFDESKHSLEEDYPLLPDSLHDLRQQLLQGYTSPPFPTNSTHLPGLTMSQKYSLMHYVAWKKSNGTVTAYSLHAQVLRDTTGIDILSLYAARKLATTLTELNPLQTDVCPHSCIAYTSVFT